MFSHLYKLLINLFKIWFLLFSRDYNRCLLMHVIFRIKKVRLIQLYHSYTLRSCGICFYQIIVRIHFYEFALNDGFAWRSFVVWQIDIFFKFKCTNTWKKGRQLEELPNRNNSMVCRNKNGDYWWITNCIILFVVFTPILCFILYKETFPMNSFRKILLSILVFLRNAFTKTTSKFTRFFKFYWFGTCLKIEISMSKKLA